MYRCPWFNQKPKPSSRSERMGWLRERVASRKRRGNYRVRYAVLDGLRYKLSVEAIAEVLDLPVGRVVDEVETLRQDAR